MNNIKELYTALYERKNLILIIIYLSYIFLLKIDDVAGTSLWLRMRDIWTAYTYISVLFSLPVLYNTLFKIMNRERVIIQYFYYLCCNIIIGTYSLFIVDSLFDFFRDPLHVLSYLDIDDLFLISVIFLFIIITTIKIISKAWKEKLYLGFIFLIVSCVLLTIISIVLTPIVGLLIPLMIIY